MWRVRIKSWSCTLSKDKIIVSSYKSNGNLNRRISKEDEDRRGRGNPSSRGVATADNPPSPSDQIRPPLPACLEPWRNFIKHPFFTRLHHSVSKARNPTTFLILSAQAGHTPESLLYDGPDSTTMMIRVASIVVDRNTKTIEAGPVEYEPVEEIKGVFLDTRVNRVGDVVGVCSGVFCVTYGTFALLWNPAIRELMVVKFSFLQFRWLSSLNYDRMSCIGFGAVKDGCDNVVNFKLLTTVRDSENRRLFSVYSLNTDKWSLVESPGLEADWFVSGGCVYLNGVLHWLAWGRDSKRSAFVLTFDIVSETFGRIEFPLDTDSTVANAWDNFLTVFNGQCLSLAVAAKGKGTCLAIWVLFDVGNKKQWMRAEKMFGPLEIKGTILGYWADGNAVIAPNGPRLYIHAENKCSWHKTVFSGDMTCWEYVESFVSPKRISNQDDFQDVD